MNIYYNAEMTRPTQTLEKKVHLFFGGWENVVFCFQDLLTFKNMDFLNNTVIHGLPLTRLYLHNLEKLALLEDCL